MSTSSENIVSRISANVFFQEFTFDKNEFYPNDGKKELADTVLWLGDLLFIIQIKERNPSEVKSEIDENNWFKNKVLKKAKDQISNSIEYLKKYDSIPIQNIRNQTLDISNANTESINKVIIYMSNSNKLSKEYSNMKFYESSKSGNIHIFEVTDYNWVCRYLITPSEVDEYLKFREQIYLKHKEIITLYPEQYILGHFLNTTDTSRIQPSFIESLNQLNQNYQDFDMSGVLNNFFKRIVKHRTENHTDYHLIIQEIALLKRGELTEFKKRFTRIFEDAKTILSPTYYRFTPTRTKCGFVFVALPKNLINQWEIALLNLTELYKYKRKLEKCIGVITYKVGDYYEINWTLFNSKWIYNKELEELIIKENEIIDSPQIIKAQRYDLKK